MSIRRDNRRQGCFGEARNKGTVLVLVVAVLVCLFTHTQSSNNQHRHGSFNLTRVRLNCQLPRDLISVRMDRLAGLRTKLRRLQDLANVAAMQRLLERDSSYGSQALLQSFDDEKNARLRDGRVAGEMLRAVLRESAERNKDDATKAFEDALATASSLWEECGIDKTREPASAVKSTTQDLIAVENIEASTAPAPKAGGASSTVMPSENGRVGVAEAEPRAPSAETEGINEQASTTESSDPLERITQTNRGATRSTTSIEGDVQVQDSPIRAAPTITEPEITPVIGEPELAAGVDRGKLNDVSQNNVVAVEAYVVSDATVVRGSIGRSLNRRNMRQASEEERPRSGSFPVETPRVSSQESKIEVVVDESSAFVDIEAEVEDISDQTKVGLKVLDVFALLLEKVLFVGLPMVLSGGALVWERVDNAMNGAEGRKGWKLLSKLKHDPGGNDESRE